MTKQTTTDFDKELENMLLEWEAGNPVISAFRIDARRDAIKRVVSELVCKCVGEDETPRESWMSFSGNESIVIRNHFRAEIRQRFKEKGIEVT